MKRAQLSKEPLQDSILHLAMERSRLLAASAAALLVDVGALAYNTLGGKTESRSELLSPLQMGRYAVRAERQSSDYDSKAERQIAFATDNDNAATASAPVTPASFALSCCTEYARASFTCATPIKSKVCRS